MIRALYKVKDTNKIETKKFGNTEEFLKSFKDLNSELMWVDITYSKNESKEDYNSIIKEFFDYSKSPITREIHGRRSVVEKHSEFYSIDMIILKDGNLKEHIHWQNKHFIINDKIIVSLGSEKSNIIDGIWENLSSHPTAFNKNTDTILYIILDSICDEYFVALEDLEGLVEKIEISLIGNKDKDIQNKILKLRKRIMKFKRVVTSLRTVTYALISYDYNLLDKFTTKYIQTVHDNTFKIYETLETEMDTLATDLDLYNSKISNKMNETMEFLTVITTIMAPLTLIAGIYGMNFKFMPELEIKAAYPLTLIFMVILIIIQVIYFKRKKWL